MNLKSKESRSTVELLPPQSGLGNWLGPLSCGIIAALAVALPRLVRNHWPDQPWGSPYPILFIGIALASILKIWNHRQSGSGEYTGFADLFIHIHSPSRPDSSFRWLIRGLCSYLLTFFGGTIGPEGAAAELAQAELIRRRSRPSRWSEQRRRTDAACAVSAGIAAAFGAPLAALLLPIELGLGGKTLSCGVAAVSALLALRTLTGNSALETFDLGGALYGAHFNSWREWVALIGITILMGVVGAGLVKFIRYSQTSIKTLLNGQEWVSPLLGSVLLFVLFLAYHGAHQPSWVLLEQVLWARKSLGEVALILTAQVLTLVLVLATLGTVGVIWPLFAIGGYLAFLLDRSIFHTAPSFLGIAGLTGASAFLAAVLGTPLSAGVLAFELTQNFHVLLPAVLAALGGHRIRQFLCTRTLIQLEMQARGLELVEGRSAEVLGVILVRDAMVTDHESVHQEEAVIDLHSRLLKSRYPFLPVVDDQAKYLGLLTVDLIEEAWQTRDPLDSNSPLAKLLEAKDLLRRARVIVPTVLPTDTLLNPVHVFADHPCLPVLEPSGEVVGLLFAHNVRLAYDREVSRQSILPTG